MKINTDRINQLLKENGISAWRIAKDAGMLNVYPMFINFKNNNGHVGTGQRARLLSLFSAALGVPVEELILPEAGEPDAAA